MAYGGNKSVFIKEQALKAGFGYCGIARAMPLDEDAHRLEAWLNKGYHAGMDYMQRNFDLRVNPLILVPGAKSVITLLSNYFPPLSQKDETPRISKYAYGRDYHTVIKGKLHELLFILRENLGAIEGRGFVDSAPVLERTWAQRSGLGWIGKNGNLITKQQGSFFFIATLITDIELDYDVPFVKDYCGTCTKCIDTCPTEAILPNKAIDANRCISYYTIELKEMLIPDNFKDKFDNWMFGCDACQDVCPWNRFSKPHQEPAFEILPEILNLSTNEWMQMTEDNFKSKFRDSPLKRSKWQGIQRNLLFLQP